MQHFVGAGRWDDHAVLAELRRHVGEELGDPEAVLVVDSSGVPKKGTDSCGVDRQWCGRLGKIDNCQVGYFLAYAAPGGHAPLDRRLFLPRDRAADGDHRRKTYVPKDVVFQEGWRIGLDLLQRSGPEVPHGWVTGDDEFGRATAFRAQLRLRERYVLDVPANTLVRDGGHAAGRQAAAVRAGGGLGGAAAASRWKTFAIRAGEKGPLEVRALQQRLQTKDEDGCVGPSERLVVIRSLGEEPQTWYTVSNARRQEQLATLVRGPRRAAPDRGGAAGRERRGGTGALRGAQLGGLAPPHDAGVAGPVVPDAGAAAVGGKKHRR